MLRKVGSSWLFGELRCSGRVGISWLFGDLRCSGRVGISWLLGELRCSGRVGSSCLLGELRCSGRVGSSKIRYIFFFFNSNVCVIDGHECYVPSCCSHYQSLFMINHRILS